MTQTIQKLAAQMSKAFEGKERVNGETFRKLKDGSPEWMTTVCREAHGNMLPDDWRYSFIEEAVDAIADADDLDEISIEPDIYTHDLTGWLHSRADRTSYVDDAVREYGLSSTATLIDMLQFGQMHEKTEVLNAVKSALETLADNEEAA